MESVLPLAEQIRELDLVIADSLDGGSLRLFQNDFSPTKFSVLGDFVIADFSGYASKTIATWGASYLDELNVATTLGGLQTWTQTAATVMNIVYGAYYLDSAGALVWSVRFDVEENFGSAGHVFNLVPKFQLGGAA